MSHLTCLPPATQAERLRLVLRREQQTHQCETCPWNNWASLPSTAQHTFHRHFVTETAAAHPEELRKLMELGFSLQSSCAAIGVCKARSHVLETAMVHLMNTDGTTLLSPSAAFRGQVTALLHEEHRREADQVAEREAHEQDSRLMSEMTKMSKIGDGTSAWTALSRSTQAMLHRFFVHEQALTHPDELLSLLRLGFPLQASCDALGECKEGPHLLEMAVLRLIKEQKQLLSPCAPFRGRVTRILRSQAYQQECSARQASNTESAKRLLDCVSSLGVRDGTSSWSALSASARSALCNFSIRETARAFPQHLRKLLKVGFPLAKSCSALDACKTGRHMLTCAVNRLVTDDSRELVSPSVEFRSKVTALLQKRASVQLRASIGKLESELESQGLLSPSCSPPGSPVRDLPVAPEVGKAGRVLPDLVLSSGAVLSSAKAGSQIRIMKQLFDDGMLPATVYSNKAEEILRAIPPSPRGAIPTAA
eukprot:COSAG01_NODE_11694_length_1878_cov_1.565486_1_plen_480_part_00